MATTQPRSIAKWNARGDRWHWCRGYHGPTFCGVKKLSSVGECKPSPNNAAEACKRCERAAKGGA